MKELAEAIVARYEASPINESARLYFVEAPQDTAIPYVTFFFLPAITERTFGEKFENCQVQFSIWDDSDDPARVCAIFKLLKGAFDDAEVALNVADYHTIYLTRVSSNLIPDPDGGWQYQVDYEIQLQEA